MKNIEVTECADCPFLDWHCDIDEDYERLNCNLMESLLMEGYQDSGIYFGKVKDEGHKGSPSWCPLKESKVEVKIKKV